MELIDRDVLIADLTKMKPFYDAIDLDGMIRALKDAPTIDAAQVVYGRWVAQHNYPGTYSRCSACDQLAKGYVPSMKYCPNCGAKMDGGEVRDDE